MTQNDLQECMNKYISMWKTYIVSIDHRESTMNTWIERGFLKLEKDLFIKALYEYEDTADNPNFAPRPKRILDAYKVVKARANKGGDRRIVTQEEVFYNYYMDEMKKEPDKRNEWLIRRCLPYADRYLHDDKFIARYGMTRAEMEKY